MFCFQVSNRTSGTVIPPPLVRGGAQVSKHGSHNTVVMPTLVRGSQVCTAVAWWPVKELYFLYKSFFSDICVLAHHCDPAADCDPTATPFGFWPSSSAAGLTHLRTHRTGAGPEDHSAGPDPCGQCKHLGLTGHCHLLVTHHVLFIYIYIYIHAYIYTIVIAIILVDAVKVFIMRFKNIVLEHYKHMCVCVCVCVCVYIYI